MGWKYKIPETLTMALLLTVSGSVQSSEFRSFQSILTPARVSTGGTATAGALRPGIKPVSRKLAEKAVGKIIAAWNANNVDSVLGDEFFDKSRLSDAMNSKVPRDAQLSVLALQSVQTLGQKTMDSPSGRLLVSRVSVTVKTQLTFNDPANGYQRREGVNEYIMRIKQRAP